MNGVCIGQLAAGWSMYKHSTGLTIWVIHPMTFGWLKVKSCSVIRMHPVADVWFQSVLSNSELKHSAKGQCYENNDRSCYQETFPMCTSCFFPLP